MYSLKYFRSNLVDMSFHDATESDIEKGWQRYVIWKVKDIERAFN